jgi:hypothetical protein
MHLDLFSVAQGTSVFVSCITCFSPLYIVSIIETVAFQYFSFQYFDHVCHKRLDAIISTVSLIPSEFGTVPEASI